MADVSSTLAAWSSTTDSNKPTGGTTVGTGLSGNLREIQGVVVRGLSHKGADIASASTTDLGAVEGKQHLITGTTTITSFGTVRAGIEKTLTFEGALTLTHNATSLILPGGANITTAAGDVAEVVSLGSGNWRCVNYQRASNATAFSDIKQAASDSATGVVELATAAETLTGTDTERALTAAGFAGNKDLSSSGYYKLPGGLILQWAVVTTINGGSVSWTFPTAFSSAVYSLQATPGTATVGIPAWSSISTTGAALTCFNAAGTAIAVQCRVFAIGV